MKEIERRGNSLLIDTSGEYLLLGLDQEGMPLSSITKPHHNYLTETLFLEIEHLLLQEGISLDQIQRIGVGVGPGSYTGTRMGVASAQAFAFAKNIPLHPFCSLLTWIPPKNGIFLAIAPTKSGHFFSQKIVRTDAVLRQEAPQRTDLESLKTQIDGSETLITPSPLHLCPLELPPTFNLDTPLALLRMIPPQLPCTLLY